MASSAASSGTFANPWASMGQERDLGGGVGLEEDATSRSAWTPGPPGHSDSWHAWAPRGIAMLEDLGDKVPTHLRVPPHPHEEWPNVMTPDVPTNFETLEAYLEFRKDYVFTHQGRSSGYRERVALFLDYEDLEGTADAIDDELKDTSLPVFMALRPEGDLKCHRHVLIEDLGVSTDTIISLICLSKNGSHGTMEANRILYHLIKDKGTAHAEWHQPDGASRWVYQCVQEANEALLNWRSWQGVNYNPSIRPGRPTRASVAGDASRYSRTSGPPRSREVR